MRLNILENERPVVVPQVVFSTFAQESCHNLCAANLVFCEEGEFLGFRLDEVVDDDEH